VKKRKQKLTGNARYSAVRGVGKWCVFDNALGVRIGAWTDMLSAAVEASKLNDAERKQR